VISLTFFDSMLTLINANRMRPPIAPLGLDYIAAAARRADIDVQLIDLCLADDPHAALADYFGASQPALVGISFRNVDDCFWPSGVSFVPQLRETVETIRGMTAAPIVLGGVGFSIFGAPLVEQTGADFGIHGDGETAIVALLAELQASRRFDRVPGLIHHGDGQWIANAPAWPAEICIAPQRDAVDNPTYFRLGGQMGVETKRGCHRRCLYCADPLAKGSAARLRDPRETADEIESLAAQGIDVLHLCDAEFNIPARHARSVCDELIRGRLDRRVRWYAYLAVVPFDADLARRMAAAGCVGINFTGDAADPAMLATYRQAHRPDDLARAARLCRENGITVMFDLLLGGPGERPDTVRRTIEFMKHIEPDCVGAALGVRLYPGTAVTAQLAAEGSLEHNNGLRRHYDGPVDLTKPTFYISPELGDRPAALVSDLIAGDQRFFEPEDEVTAVVASSDAPGDHNYNENEALSAAIAAGARGAYWDILRQLR